jgi:hypothetical protein
MTFWDSFFASDGMLRAGHVGMVRAFCDWLVKTARPTGRPGDVMGILRGGDRAARDGMQDGVVEQGPDRLGARSHSPIGSTPPRGWPPTLNSMYVNMLALLFVSPPKSAA